MAPGLHRLKKDTEQDEGDAEVEGEIDLTALAEDEEGEDNRIAGLEIIRQVHSEGREALQGLDLQQIHAHGTEEGVTEHIPEIRAFGNDDDGLLAWEKPQIEGDDGRDDDETA